MADNGEPSTARLLAYLMMDGMPQPATNVDRCYRLSVCGFPNPEIADIIGISIGSVNTNLYEARKKLGGPKKTAAKNSTTTKAKKN